MNCFNVLDELSTYTQKVREFLPTVPTFSFLKKQVNRIGYAAQQSKQRRNSKNQIASYFKFLIIEFIDIFLKKYQLKLAKVTLIDESEIVEELNIEFSVHSQTINTQSQEKAKRDIHLYKEKEMSNLSDKTWQSFINAGTNFGSLRFVKECRKCLNNEKSILTILWEHTVILEKKYCIT